MTIKKNNSLFKKKLLVIVAIATLPLCYDAAANSAIKKKKFTHFTSGTGFFISPHQIITNEHVVKDCKYIKVRGAVKPDHATVVFRDTVNDLALLKTSASSGRVAQLRGENTPVEVGEAVTVMGYPLEHGINGEYMVKKGTITDTQDMYQGVKRLQFTDTVEKGNSGGPLLDDNGNVVGVVVGKMSFYLADSNMSGENAKPVKTSSMAISLDSLRQFLSENKVSYRSSGIKHNVADKWMESKAKDYIVNVHCIKD